MINAIRALGLAALVAATGRSEIDLLEECIQLLAIKILRQNHE